MLPAAAELQRGSEVRAVAAEAEAAFLAFGAEVREIEIDGPSTGKRQRQSAAEHGAVAERALILIEMRRAREAEDFHLARLRYCADSQEEQEKRGSEEAAFSASGAYGA